MKNTHNKVEVTIVIPAVMDIEHCSIISSYLNSNVIDQVFVQFVYLSNKKEVEKTLNSNIKTFDDHEIIHVMNDRYFGSCEENIYRVQDFAGLFKPLVFLVGEHDNIEWDLLTEALDYFKSHHLDAMGWNILSQQLLADNSYSSEPAVIPLTDDTLANNYVNMLFGGQSLPFSVGYAAIISTYGPIDWAAYLGNHLFKIEVFYKLLQYRFSESIYSLVYKQAVLFNTHKANYGFFEKSVIHRISNEFLKIKTSTHSFGWLEEHRRVNGNSNVFWISNLSHLTQVEDTALFNSISYSFCVGNVPNELGEITYMRSSMLKNILQWSINVIAYKLEGKSYYFPQAVGSGSLQDVRYIHLYLTKFLSIMYSSPSFQNVLPSDLLQRLSDAKLYLSQYLDNIYSSDVLLKHAYERILTALPLLTDETLASLNNLSFRELIKA
jgi:hypothetical protein